MFDSFRSSVAATRESDQLFFAALIPAERIASTKRLGKEDPIET
jgi:hypothetical protein